MDLLGQIAASLLYGVALTATTVLLGVAMTGAAAFLLSVLPNRLTRPIDAAVARAAKRLTIGSGVGLGILIGSVGAAWSYEYGWLSPVV